MQIPVSMKGSSCTLPKMQSQTPVLAAPWCRSDDNKRKTAERKNCRASREIPDQFQAPGSQILRKILNQSLGVKGWDGPETCTRADEVRPRMWRRATSRTSMNHSVPKEKRKLWNYANQIKLHWRGNSTRNPKPSFSTAPVNILLPH